MTEITVSMVKELRAATGAGPLDCKKALQACEGDFDAAIDFLREKGLASAAKKLSAGRVMNEGVIQTYQHFNGRLGVMVEVNCETDFVASSAPFQEFARNVALHVANMAPEYVRREDVPDAVVQAERDLQLRILQEDEKNARKPPAILEKIIEGRMGKFFGGIVLMEQEFLLDDAKTVAGALAETVALLGESIEVRRFARFAVGEDGNGAG